MSTTKLNELIDKIIAKTNLSNYGYHTTKDSIVSTTRDKFNKVIHYLYINDSILSNLAPESINILATSVKDSNSKSTIAYILAKYRSSRSSRKNRLPSFTLSGEKTYKLAFTSFNTVRAFLDSIGLYSRTYFIWKYFLENTTELDKLHSFVSRYNSKLTKSDIIKAQVDTISALGLLRTSKDIEESTFYRTIYDNIKGFDVGHNIPIAYEKVELIANNKELLTELIEETLTSAGVSLPGLNTGRTKAAIVSKIQKQAHAKLYEVISKYNFIARKDIADSMGSNGTISVFIEDTASNQGSESELRIIQEFRNLFIGEIRKNFSKSRMDDSIIINQKGSSSFKEAIELTLLETILNKPISNKKSSSTSNYKPKNIKLAKSTNKVTRSNIVTKVKGNKLRSTSGAFQSVTNLQGLISARLQEVIRKNMAPPALTYQTGRFAESVKLNSVQFDNRQNALTAFLSYMKYPYATFEPGGDQGSVDKSPAALIDRSAREIATQLTKSRMRTVIV